jgi:hypothetical protein
MSMTSKETRKNDIACGQGCGPRVKSVAILTLNELRGLIANGSACSKACSDGKGDAKVEMASVSNVQDYSEEQVMSWSLIVDAAKKRLKDAKAERSRSRAI